MWMSMDSSQATKRQQHHQQHQQQQEQQQQKQKQQQEQQQKQQQQEQHQQQQGEEDKDGLPSLASALLRTKDDRREQQEHEEQAEQQEDQQQQQQQRRGWERNDGLIEERPANEHEFPSLVESRHSPKKKRAQSQPLPVSPRAPQPMASQPNETPPRVRSVSEPAAAHESPSRDPSSPYPQDRTVAQRYEAVTALMAEQSFINHWSTHGSTPNVQAPQVLRQGVLHYGSGEVCLTKPPFSDEELKTMSRTDFEKKFLLLENFYRARVYMAKVGGSEEVKQQMFSRFFNNEVMEPPQ
ncbi:unnamed protein product [Vitrella brassicaformis CCMP3155]|uniref:Uncharacterized protein n=1 Tax=Vitrella brassicaformis (strain CCMP3155) TaxID=1169540 RepID=A0A0G4E8A2_VITBC|nr:unnamed protein product [Vitrella brassicaformis CCMP3155]|eukprot:CEL91584.1 unnamed protein product [Vitrella brassicaformis CCMP3155]